MALINIVGLSSSDPVPGVYLQINFAQGNASNGGGVYNAVLMGNKLAAAPATVDTVVYNSVSPVVVDVEQDAIAQFGAGSELHLGFQAFRSINRVTPLSLVAVAEGASAAAATATVTVTGTATAPGTLRLFIEDQLVEVGFAQGDTPTVIATAAVPLINARANLACTAANAAGVITLTAKNKGLRGNNKRYSAAVFGVGTGVTVSPTARTNFTGGTVQDDNTNALATINSSRNYYYVPAQDDALNLGRVQTQLDSMAGAIVGLRQRAVCASVSNSVSSVITIATGLNSARMELVHQLESDKSVMQLAANMAAVYSLMETALGDQYTLNYNGFGNDAFSSQFWNLPASVSGAKLSRSQIASCLNNGITPIGSNTNGSTYLVRRVTTRSLNGGVQDYRIRDASKVTVSDQFGDDIVAQARARFGGKVIGNDPAPGQRRPGVQVVTPNLFKAMIFSVLDEYDNNNLLQNVVSTKAGVNCVRESSPSTRISARIPIQVIDILNQMAVSVDEISQG